ncbi:hypothetical protein HEP86_32085 [Streptomyces sp. RPA4-5]|nr:hypothetical protein HEP86_32085 [Streptomyces sp. RPA4-5]
MVRYNTLTFAAATALGPAIVTGGFSIQYVRPALGRTLRARAQVVQAGRRQAVCAVAQGTAMTLNGPAGGGGAEA